MAEIGFLKNSLDGVSDHVERIKKAVGAELDTMVADFKSEIDALR
jgi:hypothetical protein